MDLIILLDISLSPDLLQLTPFPADVQTLPPISKPSDTNCNYEEEVALYTVKVSVGKLHIDTGFIFT